MFNKFMKNKKQEVETEEISQNTKNIETFYEAVLDVQDTKKDLLINKFISELKSKVIEDASKGLKSTVKEINYGDYFSFYNELGEDIYTMIRDNLITVGELEKLIVEGLGKQFKVDVEEDKEKHRSNYFVNISWKEEN